MIYINIDIWSHAVVHRKEELVSRRALPWWPSRLFRCGGSLAIRLALLALVLGGGFSACGIQATGAPTSTAAIVLTPTLTPSVAATPVAFPTSDGVSLGGELYGDASGQGVQAIILSDEGDNSRVRWLPLARQLAAWGYLVLSYSYRMQGTPDHQASQAVTDLRAAIAFLRTRHIAALTLMGSSLGGMVSVKAATVERVDAIVAISAPIEYQDVRLSDTELQRLGVPKFFVTSEENYPFTEDIQHMYDVTPVPKEMHVYPGRVHGLGLFEGATGIDLLPKLQRF